MACNKADVFLGNLRKGNSLKTIGQPPATIRNNQLQGEFRATTFATETNDKSFKATGLTLKIKSYEKDDDFCSDDEHDAYACTDDGKERQEREAKSRKQSGEQKREGEERGEVQGEEE
jgi:hypothetical protein